jgi:putative sigma-54 modulation protein
MRLALTGRNVDITPALRQLVSRRIARLERLFDSHIVSAGVVLHEERARRKAQITLHMRGDHVFRGTGAADTWSAALTAAVAKVEQQAVTMKGKWEARKRRAASPRRLAAEAITGAPVDDDVPGPRIVRMRRYPVKPMSLEDAALKVGDTPNAFLVFRDAETEGVLVLYRRPDGALGLIDPGA